MISELEGHETVLRELFGIERQLIEIADEDLVDVQPLQERTSSLVRQYFRLCTALQDRQALLAEVYEHTKAFVDSSETIEGWVPLATAQVDSVVVASPEPSVEEKLTILQVGLFSYERTPWMLCMNF